MKDIISLLNLLTDVRIFLLISLVCFCDCMLLACMWGKEASFKVFFYLLTTLYFLVQPKYIQALIDKAKQREREQEIVYERKLAKERDKDDHLFADKDKFVTSAYKKKLAEQAMWLEEERLRQLREEKEDVCLLYVWSSYNITCSYIF